MTSTDFLYPFIEGSETDAPALLTDLAASAQSKSEESARTQQETLATYAEAIASAGVQMAERFAAGGRLYSFGNGGSSTDAATLASLFCRPAYGRAVPAWCLAEDQAVVTALGNDIGFDVIFSRQLNAHGGPHDVAVALSTSGSSADLLAALEQARSQGMLTIGFSGHDGGPMATSDAVDFCFTVRSQSIHRIQESQALVAYHLWLTCQDHLKRVRAAARGTDTESAR